MADYLKIWYEHLHESGIIRKEYYIDEENLAVDSLCFFLLPFFLFVIAVIGAYDIIREKEKKATRNEVQLPQKMRLKRLSKIKRLRTLIESIKTRTVEIEDELWKLEHDSGLK